MPTLEITPRQLAKKFDLIDPGETNYDWSTQTRVFPRGVFLAAIKTAMGFDTAVITAVSGTIFADDTTPD